MKWTEQQVGDWLVSIGLGRLKELFIRSDINGEVLFELDEDPLIELGIDNVTIRKLLNEIALLDDEKDENAEEVDVGKDGSAQGATDAMAASVAKGACASTKPLHVACARAAAARGIC